MILELYDHIGSTRHGDDLTLADSPIPRIGEWLYFHHEADVVANTLNLFRNGAVGSSIG